MTRLKAPLFGVDSTSGVPIAAHHAVGSRFAARYSSRYTPKVITHGEYEAYRAAGLGLIVVFEDAADNALKGYDQGKSDALFAKSQTTAAGRPADRPVFFAVDFDSSANPGAIDAYFDGVAAVMTRELSGPYGGYSTVAQTFERGFKWAWQTYAWSGGRVHPQAQVMQYSNDHTVGGIGVDFDHALDVDYGQWGFVTVAPDPHSYARFPEKPVMIEKRSISERTIVMRYDVLRAQQTKHRHPSARELAGLRSDLHLAAMRIYANAQADRVKGKDGRLLPAAYTAWHRGWRIQQLLHRSQGQRVA